MPLRINLEMVVSWVKNFFSQTMEEKLSFGSSFKKHSFINTNFGLANEEAVNDHRLLHRITISFKRRCNVRAATSWRSPYDLLLWDDGFCAQESLLKFVHFWCNPKLRTREEKYEFKNVHLPSKKISRGRP
jgi:hypothetical protein